MRKKRKTILVVLATLVLAAVAWLVFAPPSPLDRPVMDGQPIYYWLARMGSGDDRDQIRDRLVSLGPEVVPPLLAALEYRPSPILVKISPFLEGHFPAAYRWLWRRGPPPNWMASYTLAAMPPEPRIRDGLIRALRRMEDKKTESGIGFYAAQGIAEHYTNEPTILIPELRAALKVPHHNVAAVAARALPRFGTNGLIALPDLIDMLSGKSGPITNSSYSSTPIHWHCIDSARRLGEMGVAAKAALPVLCEAETDGDVQVRTAATEARRRIETALAPAQGNLLSREPR